MRFPCSTRPSWISKHYKGPRKEPVYMTEPYPTVTPIKKQTSTSSPVIVHADRVLIEKQQCRQDQAHNSERLFKPQVMDDWDQPAERDSPDLEGDFSSMSLADERYPAEWQINAARQAFREKYIASPHYQRKVDEELYEQGLIMAELLDLRGRMEEKEYEELIVRQSVSKGLMVELLLTLPGRRGRHTEERKGDGRTPGQGQNSVSEDRRGRNFKGDPLRFQNLTVKIPSEVPVNLNAGNPSPATSKQQGNHRQPVSTTWKPSSLRTGYNDHVYQIDRYDTPVYGRERARYSRAYSPPATPRRAEYLAGDGDRSRFDCYGPQWQREHCDRRHDYIIDHRGEHIYDQRALEAWGEDEPRGGYENVYDNE